MSRKESQIAELHTRKGTWKLALQLTDMWVARNKNRKSVIEMVFINETGSKIGGILAEDLFTDFKDMLKEGSAYVIQNMKVQENNSEYKVSSNPYIMYFVKTTHIKEAIRPEIPANVQTITSFSDILSKKARRDVLVDIVGVIIECIEQYTHKPKFRVTVKLRDNSGCEVIMTVWEDFALRLSAEIGKNNLQKSLLIVMLTNAKIKEATDRYPLSIQNTFAGSRMLINEDVPAIREFSTNLDLSQPFFTHVPSSGGGIAQSQCSSYSQGNTFNHFLYNAKMIILGDVQHLRQETFCLTVGIVDEIVIDSPWSYDSCPSCTTTFDHAQFGANCRNCDNVVTKTVARYKLVLKLEYNGERNTFTFWDATATKLLGRSAEDCRQQLIKNGEDVKVFPECFDDLIGKKLAVRFKYKPQTRQSSVLDVKEDIETIDKIQSTVDLQVDDASTLNANPGVEDSTSQQYIATPSLSASSEFDPSGSTFMTPVKRMADTLGGQSVVTETYTPYQLSSNKHIKSE